MTGVIAEQQDLLVTLELLEDHLAAEEPDILALMPEEGRFDRLRREAEALLERYPRTEDRPRLFGIPIGVKDIFHVDGLPTTAGSRLPLDEFVGAEAAAVTVLKNAGALVLGKTVSTEFAFFAPGPTRNPHDSERTPGGSSSGSAAAVAAGYCPFAFGTQTIGSISRPASFCGVVGYKPSYERISREGIVPLSPSLDHVGLLTIDVATSELAASLLCDNWQPRKENRLPVLGIPEGPYLERTEAEGLEHFRSICNWLSDAGHTVKSVETLNDFDSIVERHYLIVAVEAAQIHNDWYARYGDRYHQKTRELIEQGQKVTEGELEQALPGRDRLRDELMTLMTDQRIDLWISPPAMGPAPKGLGSTGDPIMNLPWTHAGLPTVTVPAGSTASGLPMGLQIAGGWHQDELLLAWANDLEKVLAASTI